MKIPLSPSDWYAISKRLADFSEKMSVGAFLYWIFQNSSTGIRIGLQFILISVAITAFMEHKK